MTRKKAVLSVVGVWAALAILAKGVAVTTNYLLDHNVSSDVFGAGLGTFIFVVLSVAMYNVMVD